MVPDHQEAEARACSQDLGPGECQLEAVVFRQWKGQH